VLKVFMVLQLTQLKFGMEEGTDAAGRHCAGLAVLTIT